MTTATIISANNHRWNVMRFRSDKIGELEETCKLILAHKDQYVAVSDGVFAITGQRVPWGVIGVIDIREGGGHANTFLGNGQSLSHVTTIDPAGQGPFLAHDTDTPLHGPFYRGALQALTSCAPKLGYWKDWSPGGTMTGLTAYNGFGYDNMGVPSPYIWAGTDQYSHGKYVSDHNYDPNFVDPQLGCAAMLRYLSGLDDSVGYGPPGSVPTIPLKPTPVPAPTPKEPPMTQPVTMPDLATLEKTVEGFAWLVPMITPFVPQAPFILVLLEGILKAGAAIQQGGDWESILAAELHNIADALHPPAK